MTFTFGDRFRITVFGESHGEAVGVIVEGCPLGQVIDMDSVQEELNRRRPGQSSLTSQRMEIDEVELLEGIKDGKATGGPIRMQIGNKDVDSSYYDQIKDRPRPGHADFTAHMKYKGSNDHRGGGTFSGRMTASFVMAGAIARQFLSGKGIRIMAHTVQVGNVKVKDGIGDPDIEENVYSNNVRCAVPGMVGPMEKVIIGARDAGDSIGGMVECRVVGLPVGIGEPMFDSIESVLGHGIFSIPAVKGLEFGSGFACVGMRGSENNDSFVVHDGKVMTTSNNAGGILGGISNGMPVVLRVAFKPTPSISKPQRTVDLRTMEETELKMKGRHDPCIAIRAVPVVESMVAICLADLLLRGGT